MEQQPILVAPQVPLKIANASPWLDISMWCTSGRKMLIRQMTPRFVATVTSHVVAPFLRGLLYGAACGANVLSMPTVAAVICQMKQETFVILALLEG